MEHTHELRRTGLAFAKGRGRTVGLCLLIASVLLLTGCINLSRLYRREARPGQTKLGEAEIVVPAQIVTNYFIVETKWDKYGPWRFLVDTGSSVTLVSPEFAKRYPARNAEANVSVPVKVSAANGTWQALPSAHVREIRLDKARFLNVPVVVYNLDELSAHFGMKIDGVLGFPLFRDTIFTMDYPGSRLVIYRPDTKTVFPGSTIDFNNDERTPLIPVKMGEQSFIALIDSGSDAPLMLNPIGLRPEFVAEPRPGAAVGTLAGDRLQSIGRLAQPLEIGAYEFSKPVTDITDHLSSIGGGVLKHFSLTFDPAHNNVTFFRTSAAAVEAGVYRSSGISFSKTPVYWRVAGVVPGSPAAAKGIKAGDIVSRIDGEPVSLWPLQRFDALVKRAEEITFTFVNGSKENPVVIPVFDLVPLEPSGG